MFVFNHFPPHRHTFSGKKMKYLRRQSRVVKRVREEISRYRRLLCRFIEHAVSAYERGGNGPRRNRDGEIPRLYHGTDRNARPIGAICDTVLFARRRKEQSVPHLFQKFRVRGVVLKKVYRLADLGIGKSGLFSDFTHEERNEEKPFLAHCRRDFPHVWSPRGERHPRPLARIGAFLDEPHRFPHCFPGREVHIPHVLRRA